MPIIEEKNERMARTIRRIVHECDPGMKRCAKLYREAASRGEDVKAMGLLKRAARLPHRVDVRVKNLINIYTKPTLNAALLLIGTAQLSNLQAELDPLKVYSDVLKDNFQNQGWTLEQIATDIEANRANIDQDESAPIPEGYTDDM